LSAVSNCPPSRCFAYSAAATIALKTSNGAAQRGIR
jgi:hypothetical protein